MGSVRAEVAALVESVKLLQQGRHSDPFSVLGPHSADGRTVVRAFQPRVLALDVVDARNEVIAHADRLANSDVFEAVLPGPCSNYRLRMLCEDGNTVEIDDAYRFSAPFGDLDLHLIAEGAHYRIYETLGAHSLRLDAVDGVHFAVWAPNAKRVSVVGDFNDWDGRRHVMRFHSVIGVWEIFIPAVSAGNTYKYELLDQHGALLPLKGDPFAAYAEQAPGNGSIVYTSKFVWRDDAWMARRAEKLALDAPISIYEVHLGSWKRTAGSHSRALTYRELADELVAHVREMGFTHLELLPIGEFPFDGSWGYQPTANFAPTSRFGNPDEFRYLIQTCHEAGIGVILDWVGAHFPKDPHGLGNFDGTALYEHEDPRRGVHADWDTLIFNYGRREVANYLIANAIYWIREFHIDALRVDAVASMLYLDYSRNEGEWLPNEFGGNENLEAIAFIKRLNELVHGEGAVTVAEESTAWPGVSRPTYDGGLGFTYKWNMGWMNDTLKYVSEEPVHRKHHHDRMTFGLVYACNENFILPLSHDEVVHGKRSILGRMPGDDWQRFANVRAYYGFMFAHPGKKLLFMGNEFAQSAEWNHDQSLDWHLAGLQPHAGVQKLVSDLNHLYAGTAALYDRDYDSGGFRWIDWDDRDNSVFAWLRFDSSGRWLVAVSNFTPVVRQSYKLGVPKSGRYIESINTDATDYGGSGVGNLGSVYAVDEPVAGQPASMRVTLPPLATLYFQPE
jgi:1,4-alpha-glucan branching enzyme